MKPYQSDFLERVKQAVSSGENSMLVYRKQGYESKAFRLQLKQLAQNYEGVLLEDRHAFTYVVQEYSKIGLYSYKENHEITDKFNRISEAICMHYSIEPGDFKKLCKSDPPGFRYTLFMCCYFLKVSPTHVLRQLGDELFNNSQDELQQYNNMLDEYRQDYNSGKQPSETIDEIVNGIKSATHPFTVYCWSKDSCRPERSLF